MITQRFWFPCSAWEPAVLNHPILLSPSVDSADNHGQLQCYHDLEAFFGGPLLRTEPSFLMHCMLWCLNTAGCGGFMNSIISMAKNSLPFNLPPTTEPMGMLLMTHVSMWLSYNVQGTYAVMDMSVPWKLASPRYVSILLYSTLLNHPTNRNN